MVKKALNLCLKLGVVGLGAEWVSSWSLGTLGGFGYTQEELGLGAGEMRGSTGQRSSGKRPKNLLGQSG